MSDITQIWLTEIGQNKKFIIKAKTDTDLLMNIENSGHVKSHSSYEKLIQVLDFKETNLNTRNGTQWYDNHC